MSIKLTGDQYIRLDGKLAEIKRQMRQPEGYPFDPEKLSDFLQQAIEGRFNDNQKWTEQDGIITFILPATDGTTGEQWIKRTEKKGNRIGYNAMHLLLSKVFKPTTGVVYTVKVLKGELFSDSDRVTKNIRVKAMKMKLGELNAEAACLIRENFTDEDLKTMGLFWIVVMHEPIKDSDDELRSLGVCRGSNGRYLGSCSGSYGCRWNPDDGFAFSVA